MMKLTCLVKVPHRLGKWVRVIVRDPVWVAKDFDSGRKGYEAVAWFQPSFAPTLLGTIALSQVDLNLVSHECCHAAWHAVGPDEERVCTMTGDLTAAVWERLMKEVNRAKSV